MKGVYANCKYIMRRADSRPVLSREDDDPPYYVNTIKYVSEDDNGSFCIREDVYNKLGKPEVIEVDTSKTDSKTGFKVKKLK